jgi:methylase of polypeptide subunit release factors
MNEEKVFQPNLTTELIISSSQKFLSRNEISSYLELGCGCGEITFKNILNMNAKKVVITDIGSKAIEVASKRFDDVGRKVDARIGNLFEPINKDERFDLIISDVAAISNIFLNKTDWYDGVSCETGEDGLVLIAQILKKAVEHLNPNGSIIYPVLSLSSETGISDVVKKHYRKTSVLVAKEWPHRFSENSFVETLRKHEEIGNISFKEISGLHIFKTSVWQSFN